VARFTKRCFTPAGTIITSPFLGSDVDHQLHQSVHHLTSTKPDHFPHGLRLWRQSHLPMQASSSRFGCAHSFARLQTISSLYQCLLYPSINVSAFAKDATVWRSRSHASHARAMLFRSAPMPHRARTNPLCASRTSRLPTR
jgi:hypothetical protein